LVSDEHRGLALDQSYIAADQHGITRS
jgi:hypothetical protein